MPRVTISFEMCFGVPKPKAAAQVELYERLGRASDEMVRLRKVRGDLEQLASIMRRARASRHSRRAKEG